MPYNSTSWVDNTTLINQTRLNNLETQYTEATNSFEQDLFTAFVHSGMACTKDGSVANQLDITAGVAFVQQSDNTLRRRAISSTTKTTSATNTTYYLYIQPDGTLYWSTTNSPATNSLKICQAATDASGNISSVTDSRQMFAKLMASADVIQCPIIVARAINIHITDTSNHYFLQYVVPATGLYRINGYVTLGNGSSSSPSLYYLPTDPNLPPGPIIGPVLISASSDNVNHGLNTPLNGSETAIASNTGLACQPSTAYCKIGTQISVGYCNNSGAPNDYVTTIIERLS